MLVRRGGVLCVPVDGKREALPEGFVSNPASLKVGLLGCGTVGSGVVRLIAQNAEQLAARVGAPLEIRRVLVRNIERPRPSECPKDWLTTDPEAVLGDPSIDIIVEVMGGEEPARTYLDRALASGKAVVSANKLLLAKHGPALLRTAARLSVDLAFEAAVGGGIPVIRTLREALTGDRVLSVHGILNGTCNYILTRMRNEGASFDSILKDAQKLGYAEADPAMDVDGHDAAQKLVVVAMLAFGAAVNVDEVSVEGIRDVDGVDFRLAERFDFNIKHLAIGRARGRDLELRVHPTLVPTSSVLANINDVLNAVYIQGRALGPCLLVGRGAGELPTAVSVVSDLVDVARARHGNASGLATRQIQPISRSPLPLDDLETRYYLRFDVGDDPGVLGKIATALGEQGVSVEHMVQEGRAEKSGEAVPILIISHRCREGAVRAAVQSVYHASFMKRPPRFMRIEDI
jgi:homoserine dehydrogenase